MINIPETTLSVLIPRVLSHCPFAWNVGIFLLATSTHLFTTQLNVSISKKTSSTSQADKVTSPLCSKCSLINNSTLTFTQLNYSYLLSYLSH